MARRKVALQARDLALLEYLLHHRVETLDELHRVFFDGWQRRSAHNRLCHLQRDGYLQGMRTATHGPGSRATRVYLLGRKGISALRLRSLAGDHLRGHRDDFAPLRETSIPHQLAVNRVERWLRTPLTGEHLFGDAVQGTRRHRPDAIYQAAEPDRRGRDLVFVEVDLGHYSRHRVLGKLAAFIAHPAAKHALFAVPDVARRETLTRWIAAEHSEALLHRVSVATFEELRADGVPTPRAAPAPSTPPNGGPVDSSG